MSDEKKESTSAQQARQELEKRRRDGHSAGHSGSCKPGCNCDMALLRIATGEASIHDNDKKHAPEGTCHAECANLDNQSISLNSANVIKLYEEALIKIGSQLTGRDAHEIAQAALAAAQSIHNDKKHNPEGTCHAECAIQETQTTQNMREPVTVTAKSVEKERREACRDFRHKLPLSGPEDSLAELAWLAGAEWEAAQSRNDTRVEKCKVCTRAMPPAVRGLYCNFECYKVDNPDWDEIPEMGGMEVEVINEAKSKVPDVPTGSHSLSVPSSTATTVTQDTHLRRKLTDVLRSVKAALGDRLLAKGPLSKPYAHAVMDEINEGLALLEESRAAEHPDAHMHAYPTLPPAILATAIPGPVETARTDYQPSLRELAAETWVNLMDSSEHPNQQPMEWEIEVLLKAFNKVARPVQNFTDQDWITQLKWQAAGMRAVAGQMMRVWGSTAEVYAALASKMADDAEKLLGRVERGEVTQHVNQQTQLKRPEEK